MNRLMILSKPDLMAGFRNPGDKRNVRVREVTHLVALCDGAVDGTPLAGLARSAVSPWVELVRRKMQEIEAGASDLHPYALTRSARSSPPRSSGCSTRISARGWRRSGGSLRGRGAASDGTRRVGARAA